MRHRIQHRGGGQHHGGGLAARALALAYRAGISPTMSPTVSESRILLALGSPASRLRDTFQGANRGLWGTLIVRGKRKGAYQLDLKRTRR